MICERCQKKKASVIHRDLRVGRISVRHLCAECTEVLESTGELEDISAAFPPYIAPLADDEGGRFPLFSPLTPPGGNTRTKNQPKCPLCGMTHAELIASGRAGCPRCYEVFSEILESALCAIHGKSFHVGRIPHAVRMRKERGQRLVALRENLREAIISEQFERAAGLRDEIRALENDGVA